MNEFRRFVSIVIVTALIFNMSMSSFAVNESLDSGIFLIESSETEIDGTVDETETTYTKSKDFIEETEAGLSIVEYERKKLQELEESEFDVSDEETEIEEIKDSFENEGTSERVDLFEGAIIEKMSKSLIETIESDDIATLSEIGNDESSNSIEENEVTATISELKEIKEVKLLGSNLFGAGNHLSTASPSVVINSTYDRYDIYTGENAGTVRISDNNGVYYNSDTDVKVIRDMMDEHENSPILLKLETDVSLFSFDNSNDNYVLLPRGFVENLVTIYSGNGYLNPQGINALDHIEVDVEFNDTNIGKYDLFEYGVLYYLSCYEGVLGEYYYYDPSTTDINRAVSFYVNNRIMDRTYNIVSEYFYKAPSGEQLSFKPSWVVNNDNLTGVNRESYAKQWINFPYFLVKAGEKYWNLRDAIEQSTYLAEYAEGYYEQYLTESPYGNVGERLAVLDDIYKNEECLLNDTISTMAVHPYVKSSAIEITGNYRADTINDENKLRAGGVLPYEVNAVFNLNVTDHRAKSVQVYLNGEKLISNSNHGLYSLNSGKCQISVDASKLLDEEDSRNVISFILLNEEGNYLTDVQGRIVNSYISLARNSSIDRESYRVHFIVNGGSNIPDINIEEGNKLSLPTNPVKEYWTFVDWYTDSDFINRFDPNEYIIGDINLYALWRESDIDDLDILSAAARCINERINGTNHNITKNYNYKNASGDTVIFKNNWEINNSNLTNGNRESYVKQWINFPYFLIKTGEKYWEKRSTYNSVESLQGRLANLDGIYKTETSLLSDATNGNHPYKRSNSIIVTGNLRTDVFNDANKMRASAAVPYGVNTILNVNVAERNAKTIQVWLNGEKYTSDNSNGLYILNDGSCQVGIAASKLIEEENSRNVVSILLLDETGNYLIDAEGKLITNYISFIRNASIEKITYKITFNTNDGEYLNPINVEEGNRLSLPLNPGKYGYEFKGWYTDIELNNAFDTNEYITEDKTLYALWGQVTKGSGSRGGSGGGGGGGGGGAAVTSLNMNGTVFGNNPLNGTKDAKSPSVKDAMSVKGNWTNNDGKRQFSDSEGNVYKNRWAYINTSKDPNVNNVGWYSLNLNGNMLIGYYFENDKVYYLDNGEKNKVDIGKMLTGWHWLPSFDGGYACYYFEIDGEKKGVLVTDCETRDGYRVDIFGRWCDNGQVQRRNYR